MTVPKPLSELHPRLCRAKYGGNVGHELAQNLGKGLPNTSLRADGTKKHSWFFYDKEKFIRNWQDRVLDRVLRERNRGWYK